MDELKYWIAAAVIAVLLAMVPMEGRTATLNVSETLQSWNEANDHCRGDELPASYIASGAYPANYPPCARRQALARQLMRAGLWQDARDTWYLKTR